MTEQEPPEMEARIRAHALESFLANGVDATPLREIADALGVTKAALYYHYPSKDELMRRLVSPYLDDLGAILLEHEEVTGPLEPHGLLRELVVTRTRHAAAVGLLDDPAVRRNERLVTRISELHERSVTCLLRAAGLSGTERVRAAAALGALEALTDLPGPDRPTSDHAVALAAAPLGPTPGDPRP